MKYQEKKSLLVIILMSIACICYFRYEFSHLGKLVKEGSSVQKIRNEAIYYEKL